MAISVQCTQCNSTLKVPDKQAGKKARCPKCQNIVAIPDSLAAESDSSADVSPEELEPQSTPEPNDPELTNPFAGIGDSVKNKSPKPSGAKQTTDAQVAVNPYAASSAGAGQFSADQPEEFRPLYDALFFIRVIAWSMIVLGILYCVTIVGLLFGWLPLWMGISLKNSADSLQHGFLSNDRARLHDSMRNLSTFFKIVGVLMLINICILALYMAGIVVILILGLIAGAQ